MATTPAYFGNYRDDEQPTLLTVANYIASARTLLQDTIPNYRYDDPSLIDALNEILLEVKRIRADLFVYNLMYKGQVPSFQANDDTIVPMEVPFRQGLLRGLCAHAMARDQEDIQDARSTTFMNDFYGVFVGRMMPGIAGGSGPGGQR